jgi:hypothetical protein
VVTHVIARFVDGIALMDNVSGAREQYLARLDRVLPESDWTLCWYCLMGTHVHLGMLAGEDPLQSWIGRVHSGWAGWLNRSGRRSGLRTRGPVVAERPRTLLVPDDRAQYLGAYIHNNPVRAGVVGSAEASSWSSHRAYIGLEPGPAVLDVARGLQFYDATPAPEGRRRFHEYVLGRASDTRDPELSGCTAAQHRSTARVRLDPVAELKTPTLRGRQADYPVLMPPHAYRTPAYAGDLAAFLSAFEVCTDVDAAELCGRGRERWRSRMRRLALLAWRYAGRSTTELSDALGISASSATNLVRTATESDRESARRMALALSSDAGTAGR